MNNKKERYRHPETTPKKLLNSGKSFAFIISPINTKQIKDFWPAMRILPDFLIRSFFPSFKVLRIKRIQSIQGKEIAGFFIICPILGRSVLDLEEDSVLDKIIAAGHIAEGLGASIIGLDRNASRVAEKEYNTIARNLKIPVTSGSAFTAWSVFEAIYRVTKIKNLNLNKSTLTVIGAGDSIGSLCARKLSTCVSSLTLVAKQRDKLEQLKELILQQNPIEVTIEEDASKAVKNADIVINANNSLESTFNIEELKSNTIVCDISSSRNILDKAKLSSNITVIKAGLIKLPFSVKLGINTGLPKGIISASLAETILLAFKERSVNHSLGDNINLDKLEEIADFAVQHGFEVWVPQAPVL